MPNHPLTALAAAGVVLLLAGCTPSATPSSAPVVSSTVAASPSVAAPTPTPSVAAPTPSGTAAAARARFVQVTTAASTSLAAVAATDRLALADQICDGFAAGRSESQVASALQSDPRASALSASDVAIVLGAAVATICPQYRGKLG